MNEAKQNNGSKVLLIVLLFIILMAIVTAVLMYFTNESFKTRLDNIFERFSIKTNENEKDSSKDSQLELFEKEDLAEYLLTEEQIASYKLYAIKVNNEVLYSDIVKLMNNKSTSITSRLIQDVKEIQDADDILYKIYNEFLDQEQSEIMGQVEELENNELLLAINEVKMRIVNDSNFLRNINSIFSNMSKERVADILYYIDVDLREEILSMLDENLRVEIEEEILNKDNEYSNLVDIANLYEDKSIDFLLSEIGNTELYDIEELAIIYLNLSQLKSIEVLAEIDDSTFIDSLFSAMRREEKLRNLESVVSDISKGIEFFREYKEKIYELVKIYEEMDPSKVADIIKNMIENDSVVTQLDIESEPIYEITNSMIIKDVLKHMDEEIVSDIISNMETEDATIVSQMLAIP